MTLGSDTRFPDDGDGGASRRATLLAAAAFLLALAVGGFLVWLLLGQESGVRRERDVISTVIPLAEPPPPPPPPPPEPKPVAQTVPNTPAQPTPVPTPATPSAPKAPGGPSAMSENAPAQTAGQTGVQSGEGGGFALGGQAGSGRGGFDGRAAYGAYLGGVIRVELKGDELLHDKVYRVRARIWIDAQGRVSRVELVRSSGQAAYDDAIKRRIASRTYNPPASDVLQAMPVEVNITASES